MQSQLLLPFAPLCLGSMWHASRASTVCTGKYSVYRQESTTVGGHQVYCGQVCQVPIPVPLQLLSCPPPMQCACLEIFSWKACDADARLFLAGYRGLMKWCGRGHLSHFIQLRTKVFLQVVVPFPEGSLSCQSSQRGHTAKWQSPHSIKVDASSASSAGSNTAAGCRRVALVLQCRLQHNSRQQRVAWSGRQTVDVPTERLLGSYICAALHRVARFVRSAQAKEDWCSTGVSVSF